MISFTQLDTKGNANGKAIVSYLMATEELVGYFAGVENDTCQRWWGKGHVALGLEGQDVTKEVMAKLCQGFAPDGKKLCRNAGAQPREKIIIDKDGNEIVSLVGGRRVGVDLTFSPPKDYSIAFALGSSEERGMILDSHRRAVGVVMDEIERLVETRLGAGGRDHHEVQGLLASMHDHLCNRDLEPDIHTHCLLYNLALGEDGKWRTFDAEEITRYRVSLDAIYQSEFSCNLQEHGFVMDQVIETDKWGEVKRSRIRGVSDELIDAFSQRRQAILAFAEEHGVSTQQAAMATRKHKDEPSFEEMRSTWKEVAEGIDPKLLHTSFRKDVDRTKEPVVLPKLSVDELARGLHDTDELTGEAKKRKKSQKHETGAGEALVTEKDMWLLLARENIGEVRLQDIKDMTHQFIIEAGLEKKESLQQADEDKGKRVARKYREPRYQAPSLADKERYIVERAVLSTGEDHLKLAKTSLDDAVAQYEQEKGFQLSKEQKKSLEHITLESGGIAVVQGFAGTGKTTVAEVYKKAFEKEGYSLIGVAVSSKAAQKLQEESKMPSQSMTATLMQLEKGELTLNHKCVVVVDEAGMMGTSHMVGIMKHCEKAGAKLVVQGDDKQLQAVQAGNALALVKDTIGASILKDVRRQNRVEDREITLMHYSAKDGPLSRREQYEKGSQIVERFQEEGYLKGFETLDDAKKQLAKEYMADTRKPDQKIILTHTNDDARSLNLAIRDELKQKGELARYDFNVKCYHKKQWVDREFAVGDSIRFLARDNDLGVVNNSEGKILKIKTNYAGSLDITVETDTGRKVTVDTMFYNAIDHNYAVTVHKSQGQTKDSVYHLVNIGMSDAQSSLVAFSRMKESYKAYAMHSDIERMSMAIGRDRVKENALGKHTEEFKQVRSSAEQTLAKTQERRWGQSQSM